MSDVSAITDTGPLYFPRHIAVAPTDSGAVFFSGRKATTVEGRHAYELVTRLAPSLDGTLTLKQILGQVPERNRAPVATILEALLHRGILRDRAREALNAVLPEDLERTYADLLELGYRESDRARARFLELRSARILVVALHEPERAELIRAARRVGAIDVVCSASPGASSPSMPDAVESFAFVTPPWLEADPVAAIRRYGAVLALGSPCSQELATLSCLCHEHDVLFVPITLGARHAGIGPVIGHGTHACWRCYVSRLSNDAQAEHVTEEEEETPRTPTALAMTATLAARELFRAWITRDLPQECSVVVEVNLLSLETRRRPLVKLSNCEGCAGTWASVSSPPISTDALTHTLPKARLSRLERLVDPRIGVFSRVDEADLPQEPLNQCRATFCLPGTRHAPLQIYGAGPTPIEARLASFKRALECYGSLVCPDKRSLTWLAGEVAEHDGKSTLKRIFAVEHDENPCDVANGLALAQSHGSLHGWRELILSSDDIDPFSAGLIEYLRALHVHWRIDTLHVDTLRIYRFWMGEKLAAVLSGREQPRVVREGLQEIWLQTSHGSFAASGAGPYASYVSDPANVDRNTTLPSGTGLYQIETPEYRVADCWRFCLLVGVERLE